MILNYRANKSHEYSIGVYEHGPKVLSCSRGLSLQITSVNILGGGLKKTLSVFFQLVVAGDSQSIRVLSESVSH